MRINWKENPVHLDHIMLYSSEPARLAAFYRDALCMKMSKNDSFIELENEGRKLLVCEGESRKLGFGAFVFPNDDTLNRFRDELDHSGFNLNPSPSSKFSGSSFSIDDPDGNCIVFGTVSPGLSGDGMPARLQHLVVATDEMDSMLQFYSHDLGFNVIDRVEDETGDLRACFLNSDKEHHSFAFFKAPEKRLDHHAYDVGEWSLIRDWADHFSTYDIKIVWGPGRHGPGNNLFFMVHDPDGNWVEISAELEQLIKDREIGIWPHNEKTLNIWGPGYLRS